jgi:SAM-dependent methyltransferase
MTNYSPKEYWAGVAEGFRSADSTGFAPVLHPDAPAWYNRLIDDLQFQAMRRALALAQIPQGARFLDIGCGTGRWLRRYQQRGFRAMGLDATLGMLRTAREHGTTVPLATGDAQRLPFPDASFDAVSDVTVVQHIPLASQPQALAEMLRVLKSGGRLILVELIIGQGGHVFSRTPQDWIQQVTSRGATLLGWFGQEFLLPDRLFLTIAHTLRNSKSRGGDDGLPPSQPVTRQSTPRHQIYWGIRHLIAILSAWADPLTEKIFPGRYATHAVLVFRK